VRLRLFNLRLNFSGRSMEGEVRAIQPLHAEKERKKSKKEERKKERERERERP
jgi:hypothetical protein